MDDANHICVYVIGVLYGTRLWQMGDSKQQHGTYKITLSIIKQMILELKTWLMMQQSSIGANKFIFLINYVWATSFAQVEPNKYDITERGWNTLNRCNLLDNQLYSTISIDDVTKDSIDVVVLNMHQ